MKTVYNAYKGVLCCAMLCAMLAACAPARTSSQVQTEDSLVVATTQAPEQTEKDPIAATTQTTQTTQTAQTTQTNPVDSNEPSTGTSKPGVYTPVPISGTVPQGARVSASYFDHVVFVGDSVSVKLFYYNSANNRVFGNAGFLTAGSLGSANALWPVSGQSVHPTWEGQKMLLEDSIPLTGKKMLYIMLGMNDIAVYGIDKSVQNMQILLEKIQRNVPDLQIVIESMTPIASTSKLLSNTGLCPANIDAYNHKLSELCEQKGWSFVDVASVMYDADGYLRREYCSDPDNMGVHFTDAGCHAWADYLYTHPVLSKE